MEELIFNGEILDDLTVDHINNMVDDNRLDNLQLLTRVENGVKRHKLWVKDRRNKYKVYVGGSLEFVGDRFDIEDKFGLSTTDIYSSVKGLTTRRLKSLDIVLEKV